MLFLPKPILATFIKRINRFEATVFVEGQEQLCHVPNTGRLKELLIEGAECYVQYIDKAERKTKYKLLLVKKGGSLVSIDSSGVPNKVIEEVLRKGALEEFKNFTEVRREVVFGDSRFDFCINNDIEKCYIEVKGITLVKDNAAMFPDAPTERGAKHLDELVKAKAQGHKAAVIFLVQRNDSEYFIPHDEMDKNFGKKLRESYNAGVEVYAYRCRVNLEEVAVDKRIDVIL